MIGSVCARYHVGALTPSRANHARSTEITSRSSNRSRTTSWPGSSLTISSASSGTTGQSHSSARRTMRNGSAPSSLRLISPAPWYVPVRIIAAPSGLLPHVRTPRSIASARLSPSGVVQCWPGWITICGSVAVSSATMYGSGPRTTATSPGRSVCGAAPGSSATIHAWPRTIATTVSGASSWMRIDHGGLITERSRDAPCALGPRSSPVSASMQAA